MADIGKNLEEGNLVAGKFSNFEGNLVIFREKIKKYKGKFVILERNLAQIVGK